MAIFSLEGWPAVLAKAEFFLILPRRTTPTID
jgi:hypothetical protein